MLLEIDLVSVHCLLVFLNQDVCVSSESCAFDKFNHLRDVKPGEIIKINHSGIHSIYKSKNAQLSICALEFIYFMRPNSFTDGYYISDVRKKLGICMANKEDLDLSLKEYIVYWYPFFQVYCLHKPMHLH